MQYQNVLGGWARIEHSEVLAARLEGHIPELELSGSFTPRQIRAIFRSLMKDPLHVLIRHLSKYGVTVSIDKDIVLSASPKSLKKLPGSSMIAPHTLARILSSVEFIPKSAWIPHEPEHDPNTIDFGPYGEGINRFYFSPPGHSEYDTSDFVKAASFLEGRTPEFKAAVIAELEALGNTELAEGLRTRVAG